MIHYYSGTDSKQECLNKKLLIHGALSHVSDAVSSSRKSTSLMCSSNSETLKLFTLFKKFITQLDSDNDSVNKSVDQMKPCLIGIYAVSNVINSVLGSRGQSTGREELKVFADTITEDDPKFKELLQNEGTLLINGLRNLQDPMQNKPLFHMIDKLIKIGDNFFEIKLFFTSILSETLDYLKRYEPDQLFQFQTYTLIFSVSFLKCIEDLLTSSSSHQS